VASLPDALLWCPPAGEPRRVAVETQTREAVVVQRMPTRSVANVNGLFVLQWGSQGTGDGQFNKPHGVAVDAEHVYVCDQHNRRVQVFR
jgi:DNA-binding beta-propeller fold protein YncE